MSWTSLQYCKVKLRGVVTDCPIVSNRTTPNTDPTSSRHTQRQHNLAARLQRKTESKCSDGDNESPDLSSPRRTLYPSDSGGGVPQKARLWYWGSVNTDEPKAWLQMLLERLPEAAVGSSNPSVPPRFRQIPGDLAKSYECSAVIIMTQKQ